MEHVLLRLRGLVSDSVLILAAGFSSGSAPRADSKSPRRLGRPIPATLSYDASSAEPSHSLTVVDRCPVKAGHMDRNRLSLFVATFLYVFGADFSGSSVTKEVGFIGLASQCVVHLALFLEPDP